MVTNPQVITCAYIKIQKNKDTKILITDGEIGG